MPRQRLSDASKARASAKTTKSTPTTSTSSVVKATPQTHQGNTALSRKDLVAPGLPNLSEKDIDGHLPKINYDAYKIADPHNLPDTLPQVSDAQYAKNERLANGAFNAQKSEILALKIAAGKAQVMGQQAKTVGEFVKAVTEKEKVTGLMIDLRNQQEVTAQKQNQLDYNIYKTDKEVSITAFDKKALDEKERNAQIKYQRAKADADKADKELVEKLKEFGL